MKNPHETQLTPDEVKALQGTGYAGMATRIQQLRAQYGEQLPKRGAMRALIERAEPTLKRRAQAIMRVDERERVERALARKPAVVDSTKR